MFREQLCVIDKIHNYNSGHIIALIEKQNCLND